MAILDHHGQPFVSRDAAKDEVNKLRRQISGFLRAKYDAAQTAIGNELHWSRADQLDPNGANSLSVRQKLRSRSRYEVVENNSYLKGVFLTICNDFVGAGPRIQITDSRLTKERRRFIEMQYQKRAKLIKLRQKLWRLKMDKSVAGEGCAVAFFNPTINHGVQLDWELVETDQFSHGGETIKPQEVDGVRFDQHFQPEKYHVLNQHPGAAMFLLPGNPLGGRWVDARHVIHWFRRDRGWLRGIPETVPALPLCAILRRYTLAVLYSAEFAANVGGVLETEGPPHGQFWEKLDSLGAALGGDAFPTESNMFVTLPWGAKLKQIDAKHPMQVYDIFVNAILREIFRCLLIPYNRGVGSSKDSNMASGVVDEQTYKGSVIQERYDCEDEVLDKDVRLWWQVGVRTDGYFNEPLKVERNGSTRMEDEFTQLLVESPSLRSEPPSYKVRWDQVGIVHTDPQKVASARHQEWSDGFRTDQQILEEDYNVNYEDWQEEIRESVAFRKAEGLPLPGQEASVAVSMGGEDGEERDEEFSDAE